MYSHVTVYCIGLVADPDHNIRYKLAYIEIDGTRLSENIC
jgi:hypothetical protein